MANSFPTLKQVADTYKNLAKLNIQRAPTRAIKTGKLRDSIKVDVLKTNRSRKANIGNFLLNLTSVYYGVFVNFGTRKMRSRPFATNAAESDLLKSMIDEYMRGTIEVDVMAPIQKDFGKALGKSFTVKK